MIDRDIRDVIRQMSTENLALWSCGVVTAPRSPLQNACVERVICSSRHECMDHMVIFNERNLRHVPSSCVDYYRGARTHLSLDKNCSLPPDYATQDRTCGRSASRKPAALRR